MEKAKVYYSDLRTSPTSNLLDKMERLLKRAGIEQLPLKDSFAAIKFEWALCGNFFLAVQDFRMGIPGMLIQWFGGYALLKAIAKK